MPEVVKWLALGSRGQLNPLTSFLGGVVGQEVLKVRWGVGSMVWGGGGGVRGIKLCSKQTQMLPAGRLEPTRTHT